jgi:hypothetical protein
MFYYIIFTLSVLYPIPFQFLCDQLKIYATATGTSLLSALRQHTCAGNYRVFFLQIISDTIFRRGSGLLGWHYHTRMITPIL